MPDDLYRSRVERAARAGMTMSERVLRGLARVPLKPSPGDVLARIKRRKAVGGPPAADLIAGERRRR